MTAGRRGASLLAALIVITSACSGSSHANRPPTGVNLPPILPSPTSTAYAEQVRALKQATIAYAQQLAGRTPQVAGEKPLIGAPPRNLLKPNEFIGVGDLVVRTRYWTAPGSADHVYVLLKNAVTSGLEVTGYGLPSSPAEDLAGRGFVHFDPDHFPPFIEGGELYVEIESAGAGRTVIAAFGEAYAYLARMAIEHITVSGARAVARWPLIHGDGVLGTVVAHPLERLAGREVAELVAEFNRSPVADLGPCSEGLRPAGDDTTVVIRSRGHVWVLTYPEPCASLSVVRDGRSFPAIDPDAALRHLLDVLGHADGTVMGRLLLVGGPYGAKPEPAEGRLTLDSAGRTVETVTTRPGGYFVLEAQPGRYTVSGTTPQFQIDGKQAPCLAAHPVIIHTDLTTHANVYCERR